MLGVVIGIMIGVFLTVFFLGLMVMADDDEENWEHKK